MDKKIASGVDGAPTFAAGNIISSVQEAEVLNLNELLQQVFSSFQNEGKVSGAIIRCDALPYIKGNKAVASQLLWQLLHSIVAHSPAHTKLLLYFHCRPADNEVMNLSIPEGFAAFNICIYTNITIDAAWQSQHTTMLAEAEEKASGLNSILQQHIIHGTGCLYTWQVFGKMNL